MHANLSRAATAMHNYNTAGSIVPYSVYIATWLANKLIEVLIEIHLNMAMASYSSTDCDIEKTVDEISKKYEKRLKRFTLENVSVEGIDNSDTRRGAYGKVIDLNVDGTRDRYVGKVLHANFFDTYTDPSGVQAMLEKFFKEIETLSKMKHGNIVPFVGVFYQKDSSLPVLVMEKMDCNLTHYLRGHKRGSLTDDIVFHILLDVAKGLLYLHDIMKIAHRDLSSNNILLSTDDLSAKIADLGSARVLERPGGWNPSTELTQNPGTLDFMPPETYQKPPKYTVSVDVFSFGCVIIHLSTHKWPGPIPLIKGQFITEIDRRSDHISEMSNTYLQTMVDRCLQELSEDRPTSTSLVDSLEREIRKGKVVDVGIAAIASY